ncbi:MAG: sigma 54-interacting transcriptional regulator [Bacillota bacterium]
MNETKVLEYARRMAKDPRIAELLSNGLPCGVTAAGVEQEMEIFRSNASAILNQLVKKGLLIKINSRPVYFLPSEVVSALLPGASLKPAYLPEEFAGLFSQGKVDKKPEDAFVLLVGHEESLASQIDKAKAAILYPPSGLHTLIIGESGTGKTLFARAMHRYGLEMLGKDNKKYPFVEFNCSDYYHNPQLLMSQLFGHIRGAFTGADKETAGLVEKADGGILFLDEVHRLPPEGQELLFYLMDTGCYRKLGESSSTRSAKILIIGATTEDPRDVLLKTFIRRIPLTIKLPAYREKPTEEKLKIIEHIFMRESTATQKTYIVGAKIVKALAAYPFPENVGQLSSEIKVLCARSFLNNVNGWDELHIAYENLSLPIREYYEKTPDELRVSFPSRYESDMMVAPSSTVQYNYSRLIDEKICRNLMKSIGRYTALGYSKSALDEAMSDEIRAYCNSILSRFCDKDLHKEEMYRVVGQKVIDFTLEVAQNAFARLSIEMSQKNILILAFHFKFLIERLQSRKAITEMEISALKQDYLEEVAAAKEIVAQLEAQFQISMPREEKYFIAILLANMHETLVQERTGLIIVAHGASTASSMANVCNRLMDCDFVRSVDAPLEQSVQDTYQNVLKEIKKSDSGKGVLLLVDMGSLVTFGEKLTMETGIRVRVLPNVTMLMALDLTRILLGTDADVDDVFSGYSEKNRAMPDGANSQKPEMAVLTMCASGSGTSAAFKSMLEEELNLSGIHGIQVLAMGFQDVQRNSPQYQAVRARYHLLACVSNVEYRMDVPFFHISKLITPSGKARFSQFIRQAASFGSASAALPSPKETVQDECRKFLAQNVICLNPDVAIRHAEKFLAALDHPRVNSERALRLSLLLHLGFMLERNICGKKIVFDGEADFIERNQVLFQHLREHIHILEDAYEIVVNDSELCYILQTIVHYGKTE